MGDQAGFEIRKTCCHGHPTYDTFLGMQQNFSKLQRSHQISGALIMLIMVFCGLYFEAKTIFLQNHGLRVEGTIIGYQDTGSTESGRALVFAYNVDGKEYKTTSSESLYKVPQIGTKFTLLYDPDDPSNAQPVRSIWNTSLGLIGIGAIALFYIFRNWNKLSFEE